MRQWSLHPKYLDPQDWSLCGGRHCSPRRCCAARLADIPTTPNWSASRPTAIHDWRSTRIWQRCTLRQLVAATPLIAPSSGQFGQYRAFLSALTSSPWSGFTFGTSWPSAIHRCSLNGPGWTYLRAIRCSVADQDQWHHGSGRRVAPNNSFKPNPLRGSA